MGILLGIVHWIVAIGILGSMLAFAFPVALFLIVGGLIPAAIAKSKDRSFWLWYGYGINLWIVALIHALVLKRPPQTVIVQNNPMPPPAVDDGALSQALNAQPGTPPPMAPAQLQHGQSMRWRGVAVRNEAGTLQVQAGGQWRPVADQRALDSALDRAGAPNA